jgi:DNA-binding IclR family transcriptional regulator
LDRLFRHHPRARLNLNTITSFEALKAHLAEVRAQGFAINNEEDSMGWKTVAAPIFNDVGEAIASVCVLMPAAQTPDWRISKVAKSVISAATDISRSLTI